MLVQLKKSSDEEKGEGMTVYISGPITGNPNYNDNFIKAERALQAAGYETVIPVTIGAALEKRLGRVPTWEEYMREDIKALMDCDAIFMLDGWLSSDGAKLEYQLSVEVGIEQIKL
jgi:hypothetical protein